MKKQILHTTKSIRFRQWSRKGYAVFAGLNKLISIGQVNASISDMAILKTNSLSVNSPVFTENSLKSDADDDEKESLLFENFLQANTQIIATDIPVGGLLSYIINSKLEWRANLCSNFFIFKK